MAVISFRSPQEGLDQLQKATDLMMLVHEIAHNPAIGDTIKDVSEKLSAAQEMSDAKKKAIADAEETLAQSKEFIDDFEKDKEAHRQEILNSKNEISIAQTQLVRDQEAFKAEKLAAVEATNKAKFEADAKLSKSVAFMEEARIRSEKAEKLEKDTAIKIQDYEKSVKELEDFRNRAEQDIENRLAEIANNAQQLSVDREAFEQRKARFEAALKG